MAGKAPLPGARGEAFATLVTSDSYVVGAVVLASSLQSTGATRPIVCMVSPQVCSRPRARPRHVVRVRARARTSDAAPLRLSRAGVGGEPQGAARRGDGARGRGRCAPLSGPSALWSHQGPPAFDRLRLPAACADIAAPQTSDVEAWNQSGYTKLNLWSLTDYSMLVYVDADCLVVERLPARVRSTCTLLRHCARAA
jgi:hypothetical protein